ncbi:MAG: chemotaxis protein CheX [Bryobacteraceae bacterium]|jgi:chemotaxis protein CheY-P-specific phosphatase CheC
MSPDEVDRALTRCTGRVLETMCYADPLPITGLEEGQPFVRAELKFHGTYSGVFHLDVTEDAGRTLATTFLGADEDVPAPQMASVICELTNMICGSMLSALDAQADIQLDTPELVEDAVSGSGSALSKAFEIDNGQMAVAIRFN